jgi:hypothetical protein
MGGKTDTGLSDGQAVEIESSMRMERFAGLELRLDTPKGMTLPCFATAFFFLVLYVLPSVVLPSCST